MSLLDEKSGFLLSHLSFSTHRNPLTQTNAIEIQFPPQEISQIFPILVPNLSFFGRGRTPLHCNLNLRNTSIIDVSSSFVLLSLFSFAVI